MSKMRRIRARRAIGQAESKGQRRASQYSKKLTDLQTKGSRGSLIGTIAANAIGLGAAAIKSGSLLGGLGMAMNPWAALAIGLAGGLGKYLGGKGKAKEVDKMAAEDARKVGYGAKGFRSMGADLAGQYDDLVASSAKQSVTEGLTNFALAGGTKMLKSGRLTPGGKSLFGTTQVGTGSGATIIDQGGLSSIETTVPGSFRPVTVADYYGKKIGAFTSGEASKKLLEKYKR